MQDFSYSQQYDRDFSMHVILNPGSRKIGGNSQWLSQFENFQFNIDIHTITT